MLSVFKLLTFIAVSIVCSGNVFSSVLNQESQKSHLRWKINSHKKQVKVSKRGEVVVLESLDPEFFEVLSSDVAKINKNKSYHQDFNFLRPATPGAPYKLEVSLKDNSIELFSFYKSDIKSYILDFWINPDMAQTPTKAVKPTKIKVAKLPVKKKIIKKKAVSLNKELKRPSKKIFNIINPNAIAKRSTSTKFRDFRYGAAFIWDYKPIIPPLEKDLNLKIKGPEYLYKIQDRKLLDDKKEAHMQLVINFYRKEKWGLMTKSISLYETKYGKDKNKNLNDFMKAVSMIRNTIKKSISPKFKNNNEEEGSQTNYSDKGILAAARNILINVSEGAQNYDLNKAILRYLVQYARDEKDHIKSLSYAKNLYVAASEAFDDEMMIYSSRVILNSLSHLRQLDKVKSFLATKAVKRILPKQEGLAYISFVNLHHDNTKQVIASFRANQKSLVRPIHPAILYNTAEAYFRTAKYKKAIKLYDEFLSQYSFLNENSHSRLRIALSYDLLGRDHKKVLKLYKDAINKSSILNIRYEAKVRYVGLRVSRNRDLDAEDIETVAFLETSTTEKKQLSKDNKKNLWLTRLRTYIATQRYEDALAYLSTLPLEGLRLIEGRTFLADGAEIVLGVIQKRYFNEDYAEAVKMWEVYKEKYERKVAKNPYMNFIVSDSFLKLGLLKSYERSVSLLKGIKDQRTRSYPLWVEGRKNIKISDYIVELTMSSYIRKGDFSSLKKFLRKQKSNKNINYNFYNALVSNHEKKYNEAVVSVEKLLTAPNQNNSLTPIQNEMMLKVYLESLYESATPIKFRRNVAALTNDFRRSKVGKFKKLLERAEYLYLESLFSEKSINYSLMAKKTDEFLKDQQNSRYEKRVKYLRGVALINNSEATIGKKLLEDLISDKEVPEYLKGLARSELSTLVLRNKTL